MKTKEEYNKLKKTYNLPDFENLNIDFHIDDIEELSYIFLQKIRIKITEKIDFYKEIMSTIVQPETNLRDLYEAKYVNDNTKETAYTLFKELMLIIRNSNLVSINNGEEENAKFIIDSYNSYVKLKPSIKTHVAKLKTAWEKDTDIKNDLSYFGW